MLVSGIRLLLHPQPRGGAPSPSPRQQRQWEVTVRCPGAAKAFGELTSAYPAPRRASHGSFFHSTSQVRERAEVRTPGMAASDRCPPSRTPAPSWALISHPNTLRVSNVSV